MAYMRLVVNPSDDLSLKRIINEPKRGMGEKTLKKIEAFADIRGENLLRALEAKEVRETLPGKAYEKVTISEHGPQGPVAPISQKLSCLFPSMM